jgi:arylsulfatase A-like enzyme
MKKLRALFHGSLKYMDDQTRRVVDLLKEKGVWEDTVLVFTTDHGEMLGDHGLITKGVMHYDASVRCPLIVAGGGIPQGVNNGLVCSLDFYPTFCDWAGIPDEDRPPLEGRSFADTLDDKRWDAVSVALGPVTSVVTDDGWRLTRFVEDDKGQLFDLNSDPQEQKNLYNDPAYAEKRTEMLEKLVTVMNRAQRLRHYRNLPRLEDKKLDIHQDKVLGTRKLYEPPVNPALNGELGRKPNKT